MDIDKLRAITKIKLVAKRRKKKYLVKPAPRYDEVYFEGLKWINKG